MGTLSSWPGGGGESGGCTHPAGSPCPLGPSSKPQRPPRPLASPRVPSPVLGHCSFIALTSAGLFTFASHRRPARPALGPKLQGSHGFVFLAHLPQKAPGT